MTSLLTLKLKLTLQLGSFCHQQQHHLLIDVRPRNQNQQPHGLVGGFPSDPNPPMQGTLDDGRPIVPLYMRQVETKEYIDSWYQESEHEYHWRGRGSVSGTVPVLIQYGPGDKPYVAKKSYSIGFTQCF